MLKNFFKYLKHIRVFLIILILINIFISKDIVLAVEPQLYMTPDTGFVKVGEEFIVDIMINSPDNELNLVRVSLNFDPNMVKVVKAERNEAIFCNWVDDQQKIDNSSGVIILTGFCQSGEDNLYQTNGGADVLARIAFEPINDGNITISWEYDGTESELMTVMTEDGSPPQNVLLTKPDNALFTAATTTSTTNNNGNNSGTSTTQNQSTPQTSIINNSTYIGVGFVVTGAFVLTTLSIYQVIQKKNNSRKIKTVVVYE